MFLSRSMLLSGRISLRTHQLTHTTAWSATCTLQLQVSLAADKGLRVVKGEACRVSEEVASSERLLESQKDHMRDLHAAVHACNEACRKFDQVSCPLWTV